MVTEPKTTVIAEDTTSGMEEASRNIIKAIDSMANIKMEQIKMKKALMLDQIERERNLKDYQKKKDIDFGQEKKESGYYTDMLRGGTQEQPQQMTPIQQTVPGPQGGMISGQAEGQYPEAIVELDGIDLTKPPQPIISIPGRPPARNPNYNNQSVIYSRIYEKLARGESISENEKKIALKYSTGMDLTDKKADKAVEVLGSINRGYYLDKGDRTEMGDEGVARDYAEDKLGYGWEEKYPQVSQAIAEQFPPEQEKEGFFDRFFGGKDDDKLREEAVKQLEANGYPVVEENISALIKQMQGE